MPYSLLLDKILQISAGKSLLVKNPDLLIKVVASAFSNLWTHPCQSTYHNLLSMLSASSHHLMDCLTIAEAISYLYLRVLSIQHKEYLECSCYCNA